MLRENAHAKADVDVANATLLRLIIANEYNLLPYSNQKASFDAESRGYCCMEMMEFAEKVKNALQKTLGEEARVLSQEVEKNNGVFLQGVTILAEGKNVSPTIYLESFLEAYIQGVTLSEIVSKILQIYREDAPSQNVDMSFFRDFSGVKDRICYRLVEKKANEGLLQKIPHIEYLDLAICFYYAYSSRVLGNGSILIHRTHMDMWGTSVEELLELAISNTPRIFPVYCESMESFMRKLSVEQGVWEEAENGEQISMQIVSNINRVQGAACILYPGLLTKLAGQLGGKVYIIPSSVHEVLLVPDVEAVEAEQLKEMIIEVNATQVSAEERLSDSLYYFDISQGEIKRL